MELSDQEAVDNWIDYLITERALVLHSADEFGEPIFQVDVERMKEVCPEYLDAYYRDVEDSLVSLFDKGLVEFDVTDDGEVAWTLSGEGEVYAQTQGLDKML